MLTLARTDNNFSNLIFDFLSKNKLETKESELLVKIDDMAENLFKFTNEEKSINFHEKIKCFHADIATIEKMLFQGNIFVIHKKINGMLLKIQKMLSLKPHKKIPFTGGAVYIRDMVNLLIVVLIIAIFIRFINQTKLNDCYIILFSTKKMKLTVIVLSNL